MKTEKEKMLSGEFYLANDPALVKERTDCKILLKSLNLDHYIVSTETSNLLGRLMPNAPRSLYIEPPFHCDYGYNIFCGENVYFNVNCVVLDVMPVIIGHNVFCGPAVHIYTANHPLNATERRLKENAKSVTIGNDCWIGGGTVICPGITIGDRCVIGAGSVVTHDIPGDTLAAGNPAKVIRSLDR